MNSNTPTPASKPRSTVRAVLESVLAQETHLAAVTRECSWRVRGSPLQSVKRLFAEQARQIDGWLTDLLACASALGVATRPAPLPAVEVASNAAPGTGGAVAEMLARHEAAVAELREAVAALRHRDPNGEAVLLLNGLLEFHETSAWMLRLVLESPDQRRMA